MKQPLEPIATYKGAKYPIRLRDLGSISISIEQDEENPVVSVDQNGIVHAIRPREATLVGDYAGVKDEVRVSVE